jgi:membrane protein
MGLSDLLGLLQETAVAWYTDRGSRFGAALAFYTLFSLAPLLIIVIALAALAFGRDMAQTQLVQHLDALVGAEGTRVIQAAIEHTARPRSGVVATLVGLVTLLFGATVVFSELQDALNTIWKVPSSPRRGRVFGLLWHRCLAFIMVLALGGLLLLSILINAGLTAVLQLFGDVLPRHVDWWRAANFLVSFGLVTGLFAIIYRVLPDAEIAWGAVGIGALVTAGLFMVGKYLIELYLGHSSIASVYGAAGSLVILLMWVYYSAQILYVGAEFTKVYTQRLGRTRSPDAHPPNRHA